MQRNLKWLLVLTNEDVIMYCDVHRKKKKTHNNKSQIKQRALYLFKITLKYHFMQD